MKFAHVALAAIAMYAGAAAGATLDQDFITGFDQGFDGVRCEGDAPFVSDNFLRYSNLHGSELTNPRPLVISFS